ncbi:MAG: hypothetical protein CHACPFDD_03024 [Phycisphaerae bacterium]|nr:hypothetical protein [Phycisphaerae bacterium]
MNCGAVRRRAVRIGLVLSGGVVLAGCGERRDDMYAARREPVAAAIEAWDYRGRAGRKVSTEHYDVYTTLTDEYLLSAVPGLMESAFDYYQRLVPAAREPREKMQVYLFLERQDWADFTKRFTGPRAPEFLRITYGGYCERGVTVIRYVSHPTTFPLLAHEGFHQYLHHHVNPYVPAWLNEGMAVMCEGQRWNGDRLVRFDPQFLPARRNILAEAVLEDRLFGLEQLLETHAGRIIQLSNREVGTYYAQLWALILFLREGRDGAYAPAFETMLGELGGLEAQRVVRTVADDGRGARSAGEQLFRSYIGENLADIESEYRAFMKTAIVGVP